MQLTCRDQGGMPDYFHSLQVFLLGKPYFKDGQPLCSREEYEKALSGEKWPWSIDKSYGTMHAMCEPEIRSNYVKLPTFQVVINWVLLIFGLLSSILLGLLLFGLYAVAGDFGPRAAALMARKAISLERLKRQVCCISIRILSRQTDWPVDDYKFLHDLPSSAHV